jgi:hypothetical protein
MDNCNTPYCDEGTYWSEDACMCFAEIQCALYCDLSGQQLDPIGGCSCIPQAQYDAIMNNCNSGVGTWIDISFDITTGVYIFNTNDYSTFVTGVYQFTVIITVEGVFTEVNFNLFIYSHCDVPVLTVVQ